MNCLRLTLCSLLSSSLLFQCIVAPGAHKFKEPRNGRALGGQEDKLRLSSALQNGSDKDKERIATCMGNCYNPDSECDSCFTECVDKCVPKTTTTTGAKKAGSLIRITRSRRIFYPNG